MSTISKLRYLLLFMFGTGTLLSVSFAMPAYACEASFLGFPAWYNGIATGANCEISPPTAVGGIGPFVWIIALNIVEILLRLAGYAAVAFIIYGGYKYMISAGSPDGMVSARKTILNAIIGLAISVVAIALVRTLSNRLGLG